MNGQDREQTELLRQIWNEMKALGSGLNRRIDKLSEELRGEIGQTNQRLDQTNQRLDQTNQRLGAVEGVLRDLADQQLVLTRHVRGKEAEQDEAIADLDTRVGRLKATHADPGAP